LQKFVAPGIEIEDEEVRIANQSSFPEKNNHHLDLHFDPLQYLMKKKITTSRRRFLVKQQRPKLIKKLRSSIRKP